MLLIWVLCHIKARAVVHLCATFDDSSFRCLGISLGATKFKIVHVTLTTPILRVLRLDMAYLCTKFDN